MRKNPGGEQLFLLTLTCKLDTEHWWIYGGAEDVFEILYINFVDFPEYKYGTNLIKTEHNISIKQQFK